MKKRCTICREIKERIEFTRNGKTENGTQKYRSSCLKCGAMAERKAVAEERRPSREREDNGHHSCLTPLHLKMQSMKWIQTGV